MTESFYQPIFVYGTLRPGQSNYYRLAPYSIRTEPAYAVGVAVYDMKPVTGNDWPHAVRTNNTDHQVVGDLVWVDPHHMDEVLRDLDIYEDYNAEDLENSEYVRQSILVTEPNGDQRNAWIYIANQPILEIIEDEHRIADGDWTKR